jgi:hypothetical protein
MMVFFSAHIAPNTIETVVCLSNGKLAFFKSWSTGTGHNFPKN